MLNCFGHEVNANVSPLAAFNSTSGRVWPGSDGMPLGQCTLNATEAACAVIDYLPSFASQGVQAVT